MPRPRIYNTGFFLRINNRQLVALKKIAKKRRMSVQALVRYAILMQITRSEYLKDYDEATIKQLSELKSQEAEHIAGQLELKQGRKAV